jgi:AraC-like DNA-binding protein
MGIRRSLNRADLVYRDRPADRRDRIPGGSVAVLTLVGPPTGRRQTRTCRPGGARLSLRLATEVGQDAVRLRYSGRAQTAPPAPVDDSPSPLTAADQRRRQRAAEAHALRRQGWKVKAIACHLNCHPKTTSRYLQRQLPLTPRRATRSTKLDAFKRYLLERWNAGCHNASQLFREIERKGHAGSITLVRVFAVALRCASGIAPLSRQPGGRVACTGRNQAPSYLAPSGLAHGAVDRGIG